VNDVLVPQEASPRQGGDFPPNTEDLVQLAGTPRHHCPLREQVPPYQAEGTIDEGAGAHVEEPGVPGTQAQGPVGEAVLRHMGVGGR
jgi:hypothetical protein